MSDRPKHTITNFKDVKDLAAGHATGVEARFTRSSIDSRELGMSYFRYEPGSRSAMGHSHKEQEEVYAVIAGSGRVKLDDEIIELRQWDVLRVAPEVIRAFEAGPDGLELVIAGGSRPEGGDGTPVQDWWTD